MAARRSHLKMSVLCLDCAVLFNFIFLLIAIIMFAISYRNIDINNVILDDVYNSNAGQPYPIDTIRTNIRYKFLESESFKYALIGITFLAICAPIALYSAVVKMCVNDYNNNNSNNNNNNNNNNNRSTQEAVRVIPTRNALNGAIAIAMPRN